MIIDTHLHPTNKVDEAWRHSGRAVHRRADARHDGRPVHHQRQAAPDRHGIHPASTGQHRHSATATGSGREGIRDYMSYVAGLTQQYPDRFIGNFTYNPRFGPDNGAAELEFHVKEYGFKMLKLHANMHAYRPDRCARLAAPGDDASATSSASSCSSTRETAPTAIPTQFYPIIREFPGRSTSSSGTSASRPAASTRFEAFWMIARHAPTSTASPAGCCRARIVEFAQGACREDRLVFGTDSPPNDPGMWLNELAVLCHPAPQGFDCSEERLEGYLGNNVAKLVGIEPTPPPASVEDAEARLAAGTPGPVSV
ncbi:MAG: amidohydrolase family protein [Ilumatobacteraceae bacterium]